MKKKLGYAIMCLLLTSAVFAQKKNSLNGITSTHNSIVPVGIIKNVSDSVLLDIVQRQTFRYFWHFAHPVSGLARERDNTVKAEYYWDYINEADNEPNLSKSTFGPEACAIGGTGMGVLSTVVAVKRGGVGRGKGFKRFVKNLDFLF